MESRKRGEVFRKWCWEAWRWMVGIGGLWKRLGCVVGTFSFCSLTLEALSDFWYVVGTGGESKIIFLAR